MSMNLRSESLAQKKKNKKKKKKTKAIANDHKTLS
jgi:hypothetical protein